LNALNANPNMIRLGGPTLNSKGFVTTSFPNAGLVYCRHIYVEGATSADVARKIRFVCYTWLETR
jgi:hypothetical protein